MKESQKLPWRKRHAAFTLASRIGSSAFPEATFPTANSESTSIPYGCLISIMEGTGITRKKWNFIA
jgi:hypothetical protein